MATKELTLTKPEDIELLKTIRDTDKSPEEAIPDTTDADTLRMYCNSLGTAHRYATETTTRIKPFLGRVFLLYQNHPHLFKELGYETWSDWMTEYVPANYGISRPEAFICAGVAKELGHVDPIVLADLGPTKQNLLHKAAKNDNSSTVELKRGKINRWVAEAGPLSADELREKIVAEGRADAAVIEKPTYVNIKTTASNKEAWDAFKSNKEVHEHVGSSEEGEIFGFVVAETITSVESQIEDKKRAAK